MNDLGADPAPVAAEHALLERRAVGRELVGHMRLPAAESQVRLISGIAARLPVRPQQIAVVIS